MTTTEQTTFAEQGVRAREASRVLATARRADKDRALHAMADALLAARGEVLTANRADTDAAEAADTAASLVDRLRLTDDRLDGMASGLRQLAGLPDPVGDVVRGWTNANGVEVRQVRVPFGVVAIIYEARPNVTADAAGIALKSGNAVLLRGSSSAANSNAAIVAALRTGLAEAGLPEDAVQLVTGGREVTAELMAARGVVDVLIPRGGAGLINAVVEGSKVPVIETGTGNCHLYVDARADEQTALAVLLNAKTQRPSVCNAVETLLVHRDIADSFVPKAIAALVEHGVTVHAEPGFAAVADRDEVVAAVEDDFTGEWLSLDLSARIVDSIDDALAHVREHSTGHSETIITDDQTSARRWQAEVDAAAVLVNASSRFVDGEEFGFGAEIGISTQKLHARGPMGLPEMTSTKYLVTGAGQVRG
ncbi:glutamate-5-semialdehyde dehydrogenase [Enemella evansiae]|uniref:glutamate-5-semialdehyde dehydrogenase n=1 Tax=Enemella evansiae TaxID=2016499 RepID=UPI00105E3AD0|nr:glutamate-5-semialdehyde dehydrogenase [Enemella evansiae]TDO87891.1 glutamate-5-semialdehyde dehydrogenase [Enemella evansiae]